MMERLISGVAQLNIHLTSKQVEQFQLYYDELVKWNRKVNLTAITEYEEVQAKHFLDSLTLVSALEKANLAPGAGLYLLDVGTGAGLPGVPLKLAFPSIRLVLMESVAKKTTFLHHLVEQLGLKDIEVVTGRAEDMAHQTDYREKFDVVVSRAVGKLATLAELTLPFCHIGGVFIAQKKGDISKELQEANTAIALLGGRVQEAKRLNLAEVGEERLLLTIAKAGSTPLTYPRRAGVPARRPL